MIITSSLCSLSYIIITHYYIGCHYVLSQIHYYVLLHHYHYIVFTSFLHHAYIIITNGKSFNNESIIKCYAKSNPVRGMSVRKGTTAAFPETAVQPEL